VSRQNLEAVLATNLLNGFGGENQYAVSSNISLTLVAGSCGNACRVGGRKIHLRVTERTGNTWIELGFTEVTMIGAQEGILPKLLQGDGR